MIRKVSAYFLRIANWKTFVAALLLYLLFGAYVMPQGAKAFEANSGKKVEILDLQFHYTPEQARSIIADYGDAGRSFAIKFGLIADTLYPLAYTFFFLMITSLIFKGLINKGTRTGNLHLFPLFILVVDYCENIGIANLMNSYPNFTDTEVHVASFFTSLKWCLVVGLALITIGALIILLLKKQPKQG
ncbi:MAG TPA: hypothetical protein VK174_12145 [Chitinophagales bacterium]|nr:hypothetical protein [Chitinophagales bacterium]